MRTYPHRPKQSVLEEIRAETHESYRSNTFHSPQMELARRAEFFSRQANVAIELAALEFAFEAPLPHVRKWLIAACENAEKATEFGVDMDPTLYMLYLALANLCERSRFREHLESFDRARYTDPEIDSDEVFYYAAEAMARLSANDDHAAGRFVEQGLRRLESGQVNRFAREAMEAILQLIDAVVHHEESRLALAIQARSEEQRASYSASSVRHMPSGLLDVRGIGLLCIACNRHLNVSSESVYLPSELANC